MTWALLVVWLHLLAVITWMGGLIFGSHLLVPRLGQTPGAELFAQLLRRLRLMSWVAIGILVVTGLINLAHLLAGPASLERGGGWLLAFKLFLAVVILMAAAHRDFSLLPRVLARAGGSLATLRWFDRLLLLLLVAIVYLGVALSRALRGVL